MSCRLPPPRYRERAGATHNFSRPPYTVSTDRPATLLGAAPPFYLPLYFRPGRPPSLTQRASVVADAEPPALQFDADQDFANVFSKFLKAEEMFAEEEPAQLKAEEGQDGLVSFGCHRRAVCGSWLGLRYVYGVCWVPQPQNVIIGSGRPKQ